MSRPAFPRTATARLWCALVPVLGLGLCLVLTAACTEVAGSNTPEVTAVREPDPISVSVAAASRQPMSAVYSTSGTLRAEKRATVTSRTRGVLEELFVEEGDEVSAGQAIAQLENAEQSLAVERYETIHDMKVAELERSRVLRDDQLISNVEYEAARQLVEELGHDLGVARLELERTTIAAPFDGVIVRRHVDLGATVSDGTDLFELADLDPLYLDVAVPERHVPRLAPGQVVQLRADASDEQAEARIERIAPVVDAETGTVKVTVAVDTAVVLRPGAFVEVDVVTDVHPEALVVPRSALVAEGRRWLLYRVTTAGDSVQAVEVALGFEEGPWVEIAGVVGDDALQPGDTIVVRGASALSDGAPIHIVDAVGVGGEPGADQAAAGDAPAATGSTGAG